jgi:hypothetical protein
MDRIGETTWDYNGWVNYSEYDDAKILWCNTLLTQINAASTQIHTSSVGKENEGPASVIIAHISLKYLFNLINYYDKTERMLGNRYQVVYSIDMEEDTLLVCNEHREILIRIKNG